MEGGTLAALVIVNIFTVYRVLFKMVFSDSDDFNESVKYSLTPNIISLFRGEFWKDRKSEFKLGAFIFLCVIATAIEFWIVNGILQWIFSS